LIQLALAANGASKLSSAGIGSLPTCPVEFNVFCPGSSRSGTPDVLMDLQNLRLSGLGSERFYHEHCGDLPRREIQKIANDKSAWRRESRARPPDWGPRTPPDQLLFLGAGG
jgi:hypothetical protein